MEPNDSDFRIDKVTRLLNENSSRTVAEVAGGCSMSTSRLSHLFKTEVGTTVGKFRRTCRFGKAKSMLADTPEVARKLLTRWDIIIPPVLREPLSMTRGSHPLIIESTSYIKSGAQRLLLTKSTNG